MSLSLEAFLRYCQEFNTIPLFETFVFDAHTPLTAFYQFKDDTCYAFLEGVSQHEQHGRYSYLALNPHKEIHCYPTEYEIIKQTGKHRTKGSLFDALHAISSFHRYPPDLPSYYSGIIGNVSYEGIHHIESIDRAGDRELQTPDAAFMIPKNILIFDRLYHTLTIVHTCFLDDALTYTKEALTMMYHEATDSINQLKKRCMKVSPIQPTFLFNSIQNYDAIDYHCSIEKSDFLDHIATCKDYIKEGDIFQIQVSRRARLFYEHDPFLLYRYLRNFNPSPLLFNIKLANYTLIGASPEILVNVQDNIMSIRPIAGTRRRYSKKHTESEIIDDLLTDPKEKAEHIMLVDLARNDVGRASRLDSVTVNQLMSIEKYAHVIHMVSDVTGTLKPGCSAIDALKHGFPAGTVTGTPKIRAMEIISELESLQREFYSGGIVFFDFKNNLKSALTIRSICVTQNQAYTQAAAGVVADSIPELEFKETENKMRSCLSAMVQCGARL